MDFIEKLDSTNGINNNLNGNINSQANISKDNNNN
jgi:hypothetical protein